LSSSGNLHFAHANGSGEEEIEFECVSLLQHAEAADRRREIEFWTRVAHECVAIGNLNSAMAVVAAFDAISQPKLTKTVSTF
jgi:hypothetical protein